MEYGYCTALARHTPQSHWGYSSAECRYKGLAVWILAELLPIFLSAKTKMSVEQWGDLQWCWAKVDWSCCLSQVDGVWLTIDSRLVSNDVNGCMVCTKNWHTNLENLKKESWRLCFVNAPVFQCFCQLSPSMKFLNIQNCRRVSIDELLMLTTKFLPSLQHFGDICNIQNAADLAERKMVRKSTKNWHTKLEILDNLWWWLCLANAPGLIEFSFHKFYAYVPHWFG